MADAAGYYRAIQYPDGNLQQSRVCIRSQAPAMGGAVSTEAGCAYGGPRPRNEPVGALTKAPR
jgi:hypothetical protein